MPRHVVLLGRDSSLAVALRMLLGDADVVTEIDRPAQWPTASQPPVSIAVVDLPPGWRRPAIEQVRTRFSGPVVVLLGPEEDAAEISAEPACTVMRRPFEIVTLWSLVTGTGASTVPRAGTPAAEAPVSPSPKPAAEVAPSPRPPAEPARPQPAPARRPSTVPPPPRPAPTAAAAAAPSSTTAPAPAPPPPPARPEPAAPPVAQPARPRQPEPQRAATPQEPPSKAPAAPQAPPVPSAPVASASSAPPAAAAPSGPATAGSPVAPAASSARVSDEPVPAWSGRLRRLHDAPAAAAQGPPAAPVPPLQQPPRSREAAPPQAQAAHAAGTDAAIDLVAVAHEDASPLPGLPVSERLQRLRDLPRSPRASTAPGPGSGPVGTVPLPTDQPSPAGGAGEQARGPGDEPAAVAPGSSPASPVAASPAAAPPWPPRRAPASAGNAEALLAELREAASEARRALSAAGLPDGAGAGTVAEGGPIAEALGGQPPELYERDLPQQAVQRVAERVTADVVALLLDNGEGVLEVWAGAGLSAAEHRLRVDYGREVIRELFRVGVGLIDSTEQVRSALTAIPGSEAETLVMLPLVHRGLAFGALIAGRNRQSSGPPPPFDDPEVERLMDLAADLTPALRAAVLVRRLRHQLAQD